MKQNKIKVTLITEGDVRCSCFFKGGRERVRNLYGDFLPYSESMLKLRSSSSISFEEARLVFNHVNLTKLCQIQSHCCFVINVFVLHPLQANLNCVSVSTPKDVVEMDITGILNPPVWLEDETEYDIEIIKS